MIRPWNEGLGEGTGCLCGFRVPWSQGLPPLFGLEPLLWSAGEKPARKSQSTWGSGGLFPLVANCLSLVQHGFNYSFARIHFRNGY